MGILLATFGGFWLWSKRIARKAASIIRETNSNNRKAKMKWYEDMFVASHEEESKIKNMVEWASVSKLYELLKQDLIEMFGEDYMSKFPLSQRKTSYPLNSCLISPTNNRDHAIRLLLSHSGKISRIDSYGFTVMLTPRQAMDTDLAVYRQIERNMKRLGKDFRLVTRLKYEKELDQKHPEYATASQYITVVPSFLAIADPEDQRRLWDD